MTRHEEIMAKIKAITENGKAYAHAHADEIESRRQAAVEESETKISKILADAERAVKHSWNVYESFKAQISSVASNSAQYETAIIRLTRVLGV